MLINKFLFSILIILYCSFFAFSQQTDKCFRGAVTDGDGALIMGAKITLKNEKGQVVEKTETDSAGEFALNCFAPDEFVLEISGSGMSKITKIVSIKDKEPQIQDFVLETESLSEAVTIEIEPEFTSTVTETATKTTTFLRDVPQSIEIVNRQLLDSQAIFSLKDALSNVTAISVAQGEGRRDQFFIRGFSATGDQFIDGMRDDAQYYRDLSNVEQIEVVKGPAAVLFGRGSSGGIVNRTTKKPNVYEKIGSAEVNFGSYGLKRGSFDFGQPILRDELAFRFIAAYEKSGSFREYFFNERYNIAPSFAWKPTTITDVTMQFENLKDERLPDRGIPSLNNRPVEVPIETYYGYPALDKLSNKVNSQAIRFEQQLGDFWTIRNVFRRTSYDTNFYNTPVSGVCLLFSGSNCTPLTWSNTPSNLSARDARLRVLRTQYNGESEQKNYFNQTETVGDLRTFGIRHTILAGLETGFQEKKSLTYRNGTAERAVLFDPILTQPQNNGVATTDNSFQAKVLAIYFQDQITFSKKWKALVGARYDRFKQTVNDFLPANIDLSRIDKEWSPRVGVVFQPNDWLSFYSSFTRSFQPSGENLSLAANNAELKPELTRNYEGGIKAQFQPFRINATLAVFRLNRDNIKTSDPLDATKLLLVGEQRTDGIELTVSGSPLRKLDVLAGFALLDARILKSNTISGGVSLEGKFAQLTPRNSGNLWLNYRLPKQIRVGFGAFARTSSFTSPNNLVVLPGFVRLDASVSWRAEKHYEISFNLKNISNRRYYETSNGDNGILPGAPVNGSVSLRYRW